MSLSIFNHETVDHVEYLEPCIICFDNIDENGNVTINSSNLLITLNCNCKYSVHRTCLNHWLQTRPHQNMAIRCLVCGSEVERSRTVREQIYDYIEDRHISVNYAYRYLLYTIAAVIFCFIIFLPYN